MEFGQGRYHRGERRGLARSGITVEHQDIGIVPRQELPQVPQQVVLARSGFIRETPQELIVKETGPVHPLPPVEDAGHDRKDRIDFHTAQEHVQGKDELERMGLRIVIA